MKKEIKNICLRRLSEGQGEAPPGPPIIKNLLAFFSYAINALARERGSETQVT